GGFSIKIFIFFAQQFHCADQCGGSLELLYRQQAESVSHYHGHTGITAFAVSVAAQSPVSHGESGETQVCLGFSPAGGEPKQIGGLSVLIGWFDDSGQSLQHESYFKRS